MTVEDVLSNALVENRITAEEYSEARIKLTQSLEDFGEFNSSHFLTATDDFRDALRDFDVNVIEVRGLVVEDSNRRSVVYSMNNATHRRQNVLRILDEVYRNQQFRLHNFVKPSQAYLFEVRP